MTNIAMEYPSFWREFEREIIGGKIMHFTPLGFLQGRPTRRLNTIFDQYFGGKTCTVFSDELIQFTKKDKLAPDIAVFCKGYEVINNAIHGTPELIVEILSTATQKRDRGIKKEIYEQCGVKEYWLVDPKNLAIEVYKLENGILILKDFHAVMEGWEKEEVVKDGGEITSHILTTPLFEGFVIDLTEVFQDILNKEG